MNSKANIKDNKQSNENEDAIETILDPNKDSDPSMTSFISVLIIIAVIAFAIFTYLLPPIWPLSTKQLSETGAFGDSYGILTSFFSCLTFIGLMFTIKQQQTSNKMQRFELKATRQEIQRTTEAQLAQSQTIKLQQFENTFFNTLNLWNKSKNENNTVDTINKMIRFFISDCNTKQPIRDPETGGTIYNPFTLKENLLTLSSVKKLFKETSDKFYQSNSHLMNYFSLIIEIIDKNPIKENNFIYISILKSQLESCENAAIFYNVTCLEEYKHLRKSLERFNFLDDLDLSGAIDQHVIDYHQNIINQ